MEEKKLKAKKVRVQAAAARIQCFHRGRVLVATLKQMVTKLNIKVAGKNRTSRLLWAIITGGISSCKKLVSSSVLPEVSTKIARAITTTSSTNNPSKSECHTKLIHQF